MSKKFSKGIFANKILFIFLTLFIGTYLVAMNPPQQKKPPKKNQKSTTVKSTEKSSKTPLIKNQKNTKVDKFLAHLMKAQSMEDLGTFYKNLKLNLSETAQLKSKLGKPPYSKKIQSLMDKGNKTLKPMVLTKDAKFVKGSQKKLLKKQNDKLAQINLKVKKRFETLKGKNKGKSKSSNVPSFTPQMQASMKAFPGMEGSSARITNVTPYRAQLAQEIVITGQGFGTDMGQILLVFGRSTAEHFSFFRIIGSWTDTRIVATIPYTHTRGDVWFGGPEEYVGESEKDAKVWVKLAGSQTGPYYDIKVIPDFSAMVPVIDELYPLEIRPGQQLLITGDQFLREQEGRVHIICTNSSGRHDVHGLTIINWTNNGIRARLPSDIAGVPNGTARIRVYNHLGNFDEQRIIFVPNQESRTFRGEGSIGWRGFIGDKREKEHNDFFLATGWKVTSVYLRKSGKGLGYGARFLREPRIGGTQPLCRIEYWADLFSRCNYTVEVTIEGPAGTSYWQ